MAEYARLTVREVGDITVVEIRECKFTDLAEIEQLGREFYQLADEQHRGSFVLDFSRVEFISSALLGKLISLNARLKAHNRTMKLCSLQPHVAETFRICQLGRILEIRQDEADALLSFQRRQ
jgi:anti-sigma B factor antagonist